MHELGVCTFVQTLVTEGAVPRTAYSPSLEHMEHHCAVWFPRLQLSLRLRALNCTSSQLTPPLPPPSLPPAVNGLQGVEILAGVMAQLGEMLPPAGRSILSKWAKAACMSHEVAHPVSNPPPPAAPFLLPRQAHPPHIRPLRITATPT